MAANVAQHHFVETPRSHLAAGLGLCEMRDTLLTNLKGQKTLVAFGAGGGVDGPDRVCLRVQGHTGGCCGVAEDGIGDNSFV
jgi:hypothetical protein